VARDRPFVLGLNVYIVLRDGVLLDAIQKLGQSACNTTAALQNYILLRNAEHSVVAASALRFHFLHIAEAVR
jgi:hypothetical protein